MSATIPVIPFLSEWDRRVDPEAQRAYVDAEVRRLIAADAPLLLAICQLPFAEQFDAARNAAAGARPVAYLRLAPDARPPFADPQGRPVPADARGRVLVAKTGVLAPPESSPLVARAWSGLGRQIKSRRGEPLNEYAEIGRDAPTGLPLREALVVMRQWGRHVHPTGRQPHARIAVAPTEEARKREVEMWTSRGYCIADDGTVYRDRWLVEETDAAGRVLGTPAAAPERKGKAA